ncbi:hypothetical protein PENSUB_8053 [Penicillium subrubescens]|uniref:Uncharacterized protein n=1 Tax=Penicillium subrubescens TaxID=1316194 RepID=A0A1Q5THZ8_9EURO|nr:hypothetical protein PENSUB_8053 [Penicillium subrubescens]
MPSEGAKLATWTQCKPAAKVLSWRDKRRSCPKMDPRRIPVGGSTKYQVTVRGAVGGLFLPKLASRVESGLLPSPTSHVRPGDRGDKTR